MLTAQGALVSRVLAMASSDDAAAAGAATGVGAVVLAINLVFVLSVVWRVLRAVEWGAVAKAVASIGAAVRRTSQRHARGRSALPTRS
jgi:hypothetical protein